MAQFQLFANFRVNSFSLGDYALATVAASGGSLVYTLDDTVLTITGAFTLAGGEAVAGSISQIRLDMAGVEQFLISGAALQLQTFFDAMGNDAFPDLLASHDTILGTDLGNRLSGYGGDDVLSGAAGDDALFGGTGSDVLFGGIGDDRMQGGTGNDVYSVDAAGDRVVELRNAGIDRVETTLTTYTLGAHVENLSYLGTGAFTGTGNALDNVIIGGTGNDQLSGLDGDDTLRGGNGDDTLTGGTGNDWLVGDAGASFVTTTASDTSGAEPITLSMTLPEIATSTATTVTGYINNATLSEAVFNLAFVLDVSGSMADNFSGSNVGDVNGDGSNNTKLDAAIAGFEALIASLQAAGLGSSVRISLIPFSDSGSVLAQGDLTTDNDGNDVADVIDAARSLRTISGTNYDGGPSQAAQFFQNAERGNNYVFFLSDAQPNNQNYDADLATLRNPDGINASIRSLGFEAAS